MGAPDTILIIDDDPYLRVLLRSFLEELGLAVLEAGNGAEGLAMVQLAPPALVLLDITMPGMTGFEVCRAIRALPQAASTPVIVMTSMEGTAGKVEAFRCGAVDYVSKPLYLEDVEIRVQTHLGIRRQGLELRASRDQLKKALHDTAALNRNLVALNQKLRHSEAIKTRFLALMRNEINNPLNGIMGLAEVIAGKAIPPGKARELAALIKADAFRLDYQIQNVFCAAELEAGEAEPSINRVDVASIIRDVADSFEPVARAKGVDLICHATGDLLGFPTDGGKLHHILANLVAHAVEFSRHSGNVEVLVEADDDHLDLHVVDHGVGLPESLRTAMFAPLGIDLGQAGVPHGHDLGLPVVKALADLLGGDIRVLSAPGAGTAFHLRLPRAQAEAGQAEALDGNVIIFDGPPQAF